MFCANCGYRPKGEAKICLDCGTERGNVSAPQASSSSQRSIVLIQKRPLNMTLAIAASVLAFFIMMIVNGQIGDSVLQVRYGVFLTVIVGVLGVVMIRKQST